jgi:two-component system, NarL family, sensor histidine kinase DesK
MSAFIVRRHVTADEHHGRPAGDSELFDRARRLRQAIIALIICTFVLIPAITGVVRHPRPATIFMLAGSVAFIGITGITLLRPAWAYGRLAPVAWSRLAVIVPLGIALFVVGGEAWVVILALTAAACGSYTATTRPAAGGAVVCGAAGIAVTIQHHYSLGDAAVVILIAPMAAFFAYTAGKRNEMVATLRQTRAELSRIAAAEERLRIARDLHDLLGHSLSLITLKAELSRRMIATDAESATREMTELEAVARQSLSDVREAVAGYRQPDLATELGAARQLLTAAGLECQIISPAGLSLPGEMDAVLAWTVREGVTNVVRHSRATSAAVRISPAGQGVMAEITDNGRGHGPGPAGSGLAGLGERVRQLGGSLIAGPAPSAGFRLQVTLPAQAAPLSLAS